MSKIDISSKILSSQSGLSTGIYASNSAEACHAIADDARCNIIVVENEHQLEKILQVRHRLPHLKAIVQYKGQPGEDHSEVIEARRIDWFDPSGQALHINITS